MRVTPRKDEVKAIVALLEDDGWASDADLAKAIIKRTAELFAERDWYAWVWRAGPESTQFAFGPVSSQVESERLAKKIGLGGQNMSLHLYSTAAVLQKHGELPPSLYCSNPQCGHPDHAHEVPRMNGRCWIKRCSCKKLDKTVVQRVQP